MGNDRAPAPNEQERWCDHERQRHDNDERACVEGHGAVEDGCINGDRRVHRVQPTRDQRAGEGTPGLGVQMRVERRGEDAPAGQRFDREEQHVRDQEERDRSDVGLPLSLQVSHGERTRTADQIPEAAKEAAVDLGERLDRLFDQAAEREIARRQRLLAADRTIGRGDRTMTGRAGPRLGLGQAAPLQPGIVSPSAFPGAALRPC